MRRNLTPLILVLVVGTFATLAHAQVSVDEAQRRLAEKLATRPSGTPPPSTEVEKLRAENLKLRERVMSLEQEVTTLKESLARASAAAGPTTRPAAEAPAAADAAQKPLLGHWRGGDITTGSGYLLTFNADGTYQQLFTANGEKETGQFRAFDDGTLEMWNDKWPDTKKHNQYKVAAKLLQLTLTPVFVDGLDVKTPKPLVLSKAE
ncbi:MAG TPA: hypothetical protein VFE47_05630 [Tepidisphaeraceae bacterium]|jgi:cell division protein FtsB|nr:hypothetical protein [Tepidisphaeraceae bacterium]